MAAKIRIGLIGYGGWTRTAYVPALEADGRARVVAVAAPSAATRERAGSELGPEVAVYTSAAELLAGTAVDGVMVAVSEAAHAEAIGAALDAGTAVLYEGPLAAMRDEIPAMIERLAVARGPTHADIELGFLPVVRRAAELVAGGTVGVPQYAEVRLESDWGALPEEDLCKVDHLAPWYVDPLDRVLGRTAARVLTMDGSGSAGRAQAQSVMQLDYGGCWGPSPSTPAPCPAPTCAWRSPVPLATCASTCSRAGCAGAAPTARPGRSKPARRSSQILGLPGMHECVRAFLDCIESGSEGEAGRQRVARLHRLGLAAERSRDTGGWVEVEGT